MILTRNENDQTVEALYESSNILSSKYDKNTKDLTIIFKKGTSYKYSGVPSKDYMRFETAESQGKVLNSHIKQHSFVQLGDVNVDDIVKEIQDNKELERLNKITLLTERMRLFVSEIDSNAKVNIDSLTKIETLIKEIKE